MLLAKKLYGGVSLTIDQVCAKLHILWSTYYRDVSRFQKELNSIPELVTPGLCRYIGGPPRLSLEEHLIITGA